jgi:hypothetical protein
MTSTQAVAPLHPNVKPECLNDRLSVARRSSARRRSGTPRAIHPARSSYRCGRPIASSPTASSPRCSIADYRSANFPAMTPDGSSNDASIAQPSRRVRPAQLAAAAIRRIVPPPSGRWISPPIEGAWVPSFGLQIAAILRSPRFRPQVAGVKLSFSAAGTSPNPPLGSLSMNTESPNSWVR